MEVYESICCFKPLLPKGADTDSRIEALQKQIERLRNGQLYLMQFMEREKEAKLKARGQWTKDHEQAFKESKAAQDRIFGPNMENWENVDYYINPTE